MKVRICDICGEQMKGSSQYVLKQHTWTWSDCEVRRMDICDDCMNDMIKLILNYRKHGKMKWIPKEDAKEVIE